MWCRKMPSTLRGEAGTGSCDKVCITEKREEEPLLVLNVGQIVLKLAGALPRQPALRAFS